MSAVYQVLVVLGSLGVFLFGMRLMSEGLQQVAGARLKRILAYMTTNRFAGVLSGFGTTALIQSSSATTVMTVGFVDAGLLTLRQAIGVIMGANIGTTVTGWLVALLGFKFSVTSAALPAVAVGMVFLLVKRIQRDDIGQTVLGFGLLFLGLGLLKDAVPDIRSNPEILAFLAQFTDLGFLSFVIFVLAGTLITIVVQSSSAAMAITLTMTFSGWIDYSTAAALILGENLGTTATAYLASVSAGVNARRAARAHMLFNAIGVLWIAILFQPFLSLVDVVVPGSVTGRVEITAHLAMFHTMFNIANTGLCIGFVPYIERLVRRLVKETAEREAGEYRFPHVRTGLPDTVGLDVMAAQGEIGKMAELVEQLFGYFLELFDHPKKKVRARQKEFVRKVARASEMQEQITAYLVECSRETISESLATTINSLVRIVTELESIADTTNKLIVLAQQRSEKDVKLDRSLVEGILPYSEMVQRFLAFNKAHLQSALTDREYQYAAEMEEEINAAQRDLKRRSQKRIRRGSSVKAELYYIDVLRHIEHIGDYSLAISNALTRIR